MKLSNKIIICFLSIIIVSISITSYISRLRINSEFEIYLIDEHEKKLSEIVKNINNLYSKNDYVLYSDQINSYADSANVSITIKDLSGDTVFQSDESYNHMGGMMRHGNHMMGRSKSQGDYVENTFPLLKNEEELGQIIIGFYDNSYLTKSAVIFSDTLNSSFIISAIFSLILSFILALFLSKSLSEPLVSITKSTKKLQEGDFDINLDSAIKNNTLEINQLAKSIDYLSQSLKQEEAIRNQYALDISHELRTPITTIKGYLEAILDGIWEADSDNLEIILEEINRISSLVDDLKNSFLLASFDSDLPIEAINLSSNLLSIVDLYKPIFKEKSCLINTDIDKDINFNINPDHFKQIVMNLMSNASKYIAEDIGCVHVSLKQKENTLILKIRDNGTGIPKDNLPFIFNRLYRVDSSRNKVTGGTGIGLYIVKELVKKYGGTIEVNSEINIGTEFTIFLNL